MNKIKSIFNNLKLREKIIIANILVLALPIVVISFIIFQDIRNETIDEVVINAEHEVNTVVHDISFQIEKMVSIEELVVNDQIFKEFLAIEEDISVEELIEFSRNELQTIGKIQKTNSNINDLRVFYDNENLYEVWPNLYDIDRLKLNDNQDILKVRNSKIWDLEKVSKIFSWKEVEDEESVVSLYASLFYPINNFIGIFEINMKSEDFYESFLTRESKYTNYYIKHHDRLIKEKINIDVSEEFDVLKALSAFEINNVSEINTDYGYYKIVSAYIEPLDIEVCALIDIQAIDEEILTVRNMNVYLTLALILLLTIVLNQIIKLILKKLKNIIETMREVQNGNLNVDIPYRSSNEIGELAHHFRKMLKRIKELIDNVLKKQAAVKDAEIRALQTQINSHFIYNVLENIKMRAEIRGEYEISDSITHLGSLMRYSMQWNNHTVKLEDEIDYIKRYVELFNMRSDFSVTLDIEIEPEVLQYEILKMTIQPLVENAIEHGIVPKVDESYISIKSVREGLNIYLEIKDNGIGISPDKLMQIRTYLIEQEYNENDKGTSIGLLNVKNRLELFYEYDDDDFIIDSIEGEFTKIRIRLKDLD